MRQLELKGRRLTPSRARAWGAPAEAIPLNKLGQAMGAKGRATRQRLLDAAVRLLRADPPVALSAVTVARAAQSSSAAFYLYFNDVPDLFHALGEQACQDARAVLGIARESWQPDNLDIQASRLVDAFFGAWSVHRPVLRYRNIEADRGDPRFVALRRDVCLPLIEALAQRIQACSPPDRQPSLGDARTYAAILHAAMERMAQAEPGHDNGAPDFERVKAGLVRSIVLMVRGAAGQPPLLADPSEGAAPGAPT